MNSAFYGLIALGLVALCATWRLVHFIRLNARRRAELECLVEAAERKSAALAAELVSARGAAEEATRAKDYFLAVMSHELRTPLNAVIGFSEILADHVIGDLNPRQDRVVHNVAESGRRLLGMINDILDISRLESGQMELEPSTFNLRDAMEDVMAVAAGLGARRDITVSCVIDARAGALLNADARKFRQIFCSFLTNAIKFSLPNGHVDVHCVHRGDGWQFSIRDTGVGIAAEDHERIFGEFEQLCSPYTREQTGIGLGLALTRRLVHLHGGIVWLESAPQKGSTFYFFLPHAEPERAGQRTFRTRSGYRRHRTRHGASLNPTVQETC